MAIAGFHEAQVRSNAMRQLVRSEDEHRSKAGTLLPLLHEPFARAKRKGKNRVVMAPAAGSETAAGSVHA